VVGEAEQHALADGDAVDAFLGDVEFLGLGDLEELLEERLALLRSRRGAGDDTERLSA